MRDDTTTSIETLPRTVPPGAFDQPGHDQPGHDQPGHDQGDDDHDEADTLPTPDEIINELAALLRDILPTGADEIVLDGEVDDEWSSHAYTMWRPDGTSFTFDSDPEEADDVAALLGDLWDATQENGDDPWSGVTLTVRQDDTYELTFWDDAAEDDAVGAAGKV
ncbi:hypothetical protein [Actinoplanes utahensis]|uniref:Uncharacterized protein n=1 Tax=Actinoplanes utahensis TaxID=1869 RepID=A0A0A6UV12_ACTUT|nr:hypothetical protein [Actinoplanes utahensis]KHD78768.1 hypothetical protein MB27_03880 [Actinoplanes utahensis]GIF32132.1 hypothetical protein Aut01nite_51180 [Actinoplanes utahensis]